MLFIFSLAVTSISPSFFTSIFSFPPVLGSIPKASEDGRGGGDLDRFLFGGNRVVSSPEKEIVGPARFFSLLC